MPTADDSQQSPCFPLPKTGLDPHFGFSATWWRNREKEGYIKLNRLKLPGKRATRVCVPFNEAKAMIDSFQKTS